MGFAEFSSGFIDDLLARAEASPRLRQHYNIHTSPDEPVQRLFNAICTGSYIRPHRHCADPKRELLVAVRGRFALLAFADDGEIANCVAFGSAATESVGVELDPVQWHTVIALEPGSVLLEVKQGPFDLGLAKEMGPWSPAEGSDAAVIYLAQLEQFARDRLANEPVRSGGTIHLLV